MSVPCTNLPARVPVNLGSGQPKGTQVLDSGNFAGNGVVLWDDYGVRNTGDHLPTVM